MPYDKVAIKALDLSRKLLGEEPLALLLPSGPAGVGLRKE
jgi:hypothetical protein